jgi:EAL domain-containing protein (putative c-di-GMP-specific phosphodiesterase class I)
MEPRTLIIDDSSAVCEALKAMMQQLGLEQIETCQNGLTALSKIKSDPKYYDAVFVDLHLPGIDGLELMHQLEKLDYQGGVIIISGLDDKSVEFAESVVKTTRLKLLGSALKPFSLTQLAFLVKRIKYIRERRYPQVERIKRRELFQALKENTILPYYQPKVSSDFEEMIGVEVLARVDVYGRGRVSPEQVFPVARRFGLFDDLFEKLLYRSLSEFRDFLERFGLQTKLSINIFPEQLKTDRVFYQLENTTERVDFPRELLMLEITEQQALNSKEQLKVLSRLRIAGYELSLDDFGSGFTHLAQIRQLPLSEVKLDTKMIVGVAEDPLMEVVCRATREITQKLDIRLIAEGIENQQDLTLLETIGLDGFQGYAICRPKPIDEFSLWYTKWSELREGSGNLGA